MAVGRREAQCQVQMAEQQFATYASVPIGACARYEEVGSRPPRFSSFRAWLTLPPASGAARLCAKIKRVVMR